MILKLHGKELRVMRKNDQNFIIQKHIIKKAEYHSTKVQNRREHNIEVNWHLKKEVSLFVIIITNNF